MGLEGQEIDQISFEKLGLDESFEEGDLGPRSKTSLRMHYEAQVSVIQRQVGNLDEIRGNLGLSQRKMAQLLMVDPSSWTRWTKHGDEAPPHVWRALQWYMALREKIPGLTPQYFISTNPQILHEKALKELDIERQERIENMGNLGLQLQSVLGERQHLQSEIQSLKKDLNFHKKISIVILLLSISWAAVLFIWKGL
jgi:transcriptional regulator with XRE-family HTH domain